MNISNWENSENWMSSLPAIDGESIGLHIPLTFLSSFASFLCATVDLEGRDSFVSDATLGVMLFSL